MSIITFYSYKGGVGRSLALANVAVLLAKSGKKILVVDWDLEAPGLEEYFDNFRLNADGRGLLSMLVAKADLDEHLWKLTDTQGRFSLDFLPSGRDESDYYPMLERFNQDDFFRDGGGDYLERMRGAWKERYDHVLIDSRTGLSDASGVCTIFMPDIIVGLFTATKQSYRGVRDVMELAQRSRRDLAYTRPMFSFVPVPCRIDDQGTEDVDRWMEEFTDAMGPLMDSWRPKNLPNLAVLEGLRVDHVGELSQGTEIIQNAESEAASMALGTYEKLANLLGSGLTDVSGFEGEGVQDKAGITVTDQSVYVITSDEPQPKYRYDIYISVSGGSVEARWVDEHFLGPFSRSIAVELGRDAQIYTNIRSLSAGSSWADELDEALNSSKILFAFITRRTERSTWTQHELQTFSKIEGTDRRIVPILLDGDESDLPSRLSDRKTLDLRRHFVTSDAVKYSYTKEGEDLQREIQRLALDVSALLNEVDT